MLELFGATAALVALLVVAYFFGRKNKGEGLARVQAHPESVARLYLRADTELDVYWLHADMKDGAKRLIAAPWEVEDTLQKLELVGLRLSAADQAALEAALARRSVVRDDGKTSGIQPSSCNSGRTSAHA